MNKSKKVLLLALSLATSAALFAACGGGENGDTSSSNESVQSSASVGSSEEISGSFDYESWMSEMLGSGTESISVPTISTSETTSSEEISLGSSSSILEESSSAELSESSVVEESSEEVSSEIVNSEVISSEIVSSEESSSEEIVGEQVATQAEWNAIFAGSLSATNVTANVAMVGEESCIYGWERVRTIGFIKVADGKSYTKLEQIYAYDWNEPGVGAESGEESDFGEVYYYVEDGKYYMLSLSNVGAWLKMEASWFDASQATGAGIVNMLDLPSAGYEELYTVANFDSEKGVYVYEWTENDPDEGDIACSLEIKIADGKIAALAMARAWAIEDNGVVFTTTEKTAVVFTYGNAEITVPEYNEEKPENSSSATSEVFSSEVFSSEAVNSEISSEEYSESASSEWVNSEISSEEYSESASSEWVSSEASSEESSEEEIVGEQVADEAAWDAAWDNTIKARNITVTYTSTYMFDGITETEYGVGLIADNKWYAYDYDDTNGYAYTYMGEVDGKVYEWTSKDGENWEVEERYVDIEQMTSGYVIVRGLNEALDFSTAQYVDGYYVCETDWATFNIKIAGGYVVEITMLDDTETISYKMAFGGAEIGELPALPTEEVIIGEQVKDATEWNKILVNTDTQTNFTYTADGRIEREDGQIAITTEYVEVDNGNVYVEREQMVHSGSGSAMGIRACYYQGYVNGVAYEWRDVGDGEWYVNQIEYVDGGTLVKLLGLEDLDFATATFDSETGAYVFNEDGATIAIKVVDSLVRYVELSTEAMYVEYTVSYDNANVELPSLEIGGGSSGDKTEALLPLLEIDFDDTIMESVVGEQVTQEELRKAIENTYAKTNFVLRGDSYIEGGNSLYISHIADGKMRTLTQATYMEEGTGEWETTNMYQYSGNVDGTNYVWLSTDGTIWECALAEEVMVGSYSNGQEVFSDILDIFLMMDSSYNETSREFYIDMSEAQGMFFSVRVVEGYVKTISMKSVDGMYMNYVVDYDCAEVGALPPVTVNGGENGGEGSTEIEIDWNSPLGVDIIGEEVNEADFKKAIISAIESDNFLVKGYVGSLSGSGETAVGYTQIADGKLYNYTSATYKEDGQEYNTEFFIYVGTVDGVEYMWYSEDGENYETGYAEEEGLVGCCNGSVFQMYFAFADYNGMKFDATTGAYVVEITEDGYTQTFSLKIVDGKVVAFCISTVTGDMEQTFVIEYGNAYVGELPPVSEIGGGSIGDDKVEVNLPEANFDFDTTLGDDIIGEEVTAEEMQKAIEATCASNNFTIKGHSFIEGGASLIIGNVANEKSYNVTRATYPTQDGTMETMTLHMILGAVDSVDYAWMSFDCESWDCALADEVVMGGGTNGNEVFGMYLQLFMMMDSEFNAQTGEYSITADGTTMAIKIVDGVVKMIDMTSEDMYITYVVEYGNAVDFTLPPVTVNGDNGGDYEEPEIPEVPDVEGEQVETAEEWAKIFENTLSATNATIVTTASENGKLMEDGILMIASGVVYRKWNNMDGTSSYYIRGNVNGVGYCWTSADGKNWRVEEQPWEYEDATVAYELEGMDSMLTFENATYDADKGMYRVETEDTTFLVKIANKRVVYISTYIENSMMPGVDIVYSIVYDTTPEIELPAIEVGGGDVTIPEIETPISDEVNAEAWAVAIADLSATINFTANGIGSIEFLDGSGLSAEASLYTQIADGKGYAVIISSGMEEYSYVGNVDGKNYEWYSYDGKTWECECMGDAFAIDGAYFLSEMIPKEMTFDTVVYDKDEGGYKYTISETDYVVIGINDGKVSFVKSVETVDNGDWYSRDTYIYVLTYGNANVGDLPPVENVGSGEEVNGGNGEMSETAGVEKEEEILKQ